jgi:hypothetical protein
MNITGYKRATIGLGMIIVILIFLLFSLAVDYVPLKIRVALASEQVEIFEESRVRALMSDPQEAIKHLSSAVNYYPSGSKQITGSRLDLLVEQARDSSIREIIAYLRQTTGEDLGDEAKPWIDKYGIKDTQ